MQQFLLTGFDLNSQYSKTPNTNILSLHSGTHTHKDTHSYTLRYMNAHKHMVGGKNNGRGRERARVLLAERQNKFLCYIGFLVLIFFSFGMGV